MSKRLRAIYEVCEVALTCSWCLTEVMKLSAAELKALGRTSFKCTNCRGLNFIPAEAVALVEHAKGQVDPDNPPGRAQAWDAIVGNLSLKRAMEIAIAGYHTLTYVGHPDDGWRHVQEILGERAMMTQRCPCGYLRDPNHECLCTVAEIQSHRNTRTFQEAFMADIVAEVYTPRANELFAIGEPYAEVLRRVERVRLAQMFDATAQMDVRPRTAVFDILNAARVRLELNSELLKTVQRVACTIADLDGKPLVEAHHMAEAVAYRTPLLDRF